MSWHHKYWDTIDNLYWDPGLLGLNSIPKSDRVQSDGRISIPADRVVKGGSIYARQKPAKANLARMRRLEEPLNHIFDIAFGIAPCRIISQLFAEPFGSQDKGPFLRLGREVSDRYSGFGDGNTTQQDGYFVSDKSLIGIELKLGSPTWSGQVLKYIALMVAEEAYSGERESILLVYITPNDTDAETFLQAGANSDGSLPSDFLSSLKSRDWNENIKRMVSESPVAFEKAISRLRLAHLNWRSFADHCEALAKSAEVRNDETEMRLMRGLRQAVVEQHGTGC